MGMNLRAFLIFLLMPVLQAELPPSAYESMQAKAPEYLRIEVLRVNVEPGESPTQQRVHVVALTTEVFRTKSGPNEKERTVAYLAKTEGSDFVPAAGRMSFINF